MKLFNFKASRPLTVGQRGEDEAVKFFKKKGFHIKERNYRYSKYEIDFIAENKDLIIFVEVKARSYKSLEDTEFGRPALAVTHDKRKFILYAAKMYLRKNPKIQKQPRIDVVEVYFDNNPIVKKKKILKINHIPNAFGE